MLRYVQFVLLLSVSLILLACSNPDKDFQQAQQKNTSDAYLAFIKEYSNDYSVLKDAVAGTDSALALETFALSCPNREIQKYAIEQIKNQRSLVTVILAKPDTALLSLAWARLSDQNALQLLACSATAANDRGKALERITDEAFLAKRCDEDPSPAIRYFAVNKISSSSILEQVGTTAYYFDVRRAAEKISNNNAKITQAFGKLLQSVRNIRNNTNDEYLATIAISGSCDTLCKTAALNMNNQQKLADVVCKSKDREVRKYAFTKLTEKTMLERVSAEVSDVSLKLAADVKLNRTSLEDVFSVAVLPGKDSKDLGDALAAVALLPVNETSRSFVTDACITLINRGDETRIPDLVELLHTYGDVQLAEDYLNCGQPDLDQAGRVWGSNHGYDVSTGYGSNRAHWGSGG